MRGRLAMFATGLAIGCLLVGMMILSRRAFIKPNTQATQRDTQADAVQSPVQESASKVPGNDAGSQPRE